MVSPIHIHNCHFDRLLLITFALNNSRVVISIGMNFYRCVLAFISISLLLCGASGEAGTIVRDFSGDAMQSHDSRMMNSPLQCIPPILGLSFWPFISYLPAPSLTVVNVQINLPPPAYPIHITPTSPSARPKFWINRCGSIVEIEVSPTTNLMEEERPSCSR